MASRLGNHPAWRRPQMLSAAFAAMCKKVNEELIFIPSPCRFLFQQEHFRDRREEVSEADLVWAPTQGLRDWLRGLMWLF